MAKRCSEDICLLCLVNKSEKKGSHYTPASIIKKVIGERDYEDIYSIHAADHNIENYKGRSNLNNDDPEIKMPAHIADYIFCKDCEKKLGVIEGICSDKLNKLVDAIARGEAKIQNTILYNKFTTVNINKNVLLIYIYSIIWRQCLDQLLSQGTVIISEAIQEELRKIVYKGISQLLEDLEKTTDFEEQFFVQMLTSYHRGDTTINAINPNPYRSNPYLFFVGIYDVLFYHSKNTDAKFTFATGIPVEFLDEDLFINSFNIARVGIVNEPIWKNIVDKIMRSEAKKHNHALYLKLSIEKNIPYLQAKELINSEAAKLYIQHPDNYSKCLNQALQKLLS